MPEHASCGRVKLTVLFRLAFWRLLSHFRNWYQMDDGRDFEDEDPFGMDPLAAEREEAAKKQLAQKVSEAWGRSGAILAVSDV